MRLLGRHIFPNNTEASQWLFTWGNEIKNAFWHGPEDVLRQFPNATHVEADSFIFDVGSTGWKMDVSICFSHQIALVNKIRKQA